MNAHDIYLIYVLQMNQANLHLLFLHYMVVFQLFGATVLFILKFFGGLLLLFCISALISKIFKLDKAVNKEF